MYRRLSFLCRWSALVISSASLASVGNSFSDLDDSYLSLQFIGTDATSILVDGSLYNDVDKGPLATKVERPKRTPNRNLAWDRNFQEAFLFPRKSDKANYKVKKKKTPAIKTWKGHPSRGPTKLLTYGDHAYKVTVGNSSSSSLAALGQSAEDVRRQLIVAGRRPPNTSPVEEINRKKKFPRFFLPWPFTLYARDTIRPFPDRTSLIFLVSVAVPFIPFGVFEFRVPVIADANYLSARLNGLSPIPPPGKKRSLRSVSVAEDQLDFFNWVDSVLSESFAIDGKACLQRLICEVAELPIDHLSFLGEALHRLVEPKDDPLLDDYLEAQKRGLKRGNCFKKYGRCPLTIRHFLSKDTINRELLKKLRRR